MRTLILICFSIALISVCAYDPLALKNSLLKEIETLRPQDVLTNGINIDDISSDIYTEVFEFDIREEFLNRANFPVNVKDILREAFEICKSDEKWNTFKAITYNNGHLEQYLGSVRYSAGKIEYVICKVIVRMSRSFFASKNCSANGDCVLTSSSVPQLSEDDLKKVHSITYDQLKKLIHKNDFTLDLLAAGIPVDSTEVRELNKENLIEAIGESYGLKFLGDDVVVTDIKGDEPVPNPQDDPSKPDPKPDDPSKPDPKPDPSTADTIGNLIGSITKGANAWSQIASAFKTTCSSKIKERIGGKGFEHFNNSSQLQITKGLKEEFLTRFLGRVSQRIKVPEDKTKAFTDVLEEVEWSDSTVWSAFETVFSVDKNGSTKSVNFWINRNEVTNKYDVIYTDIKAEFSLMPDIMIIAKSKSILGGIFEDYKEVKESVRRGLTEEDVKSVLTFFQVVAFKSFCDQFNIPVEFPK